MEKFKIIKGHKEKNIEKETLRKNKLKEIYKENYFKASISMNKEKYKAGLLLCPQEK